MKISQAVILAGGLGTRLRPFTDTQPKPMMKIEGKPFIEHLILQIKEFGIQDVLILLGYLPEVVEEYFGDGSKWNINITYDVTPVEYDTGARLKHAEGKILQEFVLLYCDNYCPVDFENMVSLYRKSGCKLQITAYANKDGYTKNNLKIKEQKVIAYDKKREKQDLQAVDIGYAIVNKSVLGLIPEENVNFEAAVYPNLIKNKEVSVYVTEHRYYSIGSWERIELTKEFFKPKKVIFLDRDGTLNVRPPKGKYIENPDDFQWLDGAKEAIVQLGKKGYQIYLITNQAGIGRKIVSKETVQKTNEKMLKELKAVGGKINQIYCCPHSWEENCECRKPKPGMLYQAQKEHSLNLREAILIGDDERDIETGKAACCKKSILVSEKTTLYDIVKEL